MKHYPTIVREENGENVAIPIRVEYTHHRAYRGATDGRHGPPIEPSEPEHDEIEEVHNLKTGEAITLTDAEEEDIYNELYSVRMERMTCFED